MPGRVRTVFPKCLPVSTPILVISALFLQGSKTQSKTQSLGEDYINWPVKWWFSIDSAIKIQVFLIS